MARYGAAASRLGTTDLTC